jgi:hypothetical protein
MACLAAGRAFGDSTWNYAVEITAAVQANPAQITLNWTQDTNGTPASYTVYRKAPSDTSWGSPVAALAGTTLTYTDTSVAAGTAYEYQIVKDMNQSFGYYGYGYIESGVQVPLADQPGTCILIVDNTYSSALASGLQQLQQDLMAEGWNVVRHDVSRTDSVTSVKALIQADYAADPNDVNTVFLFGHVPVPYSGQINPDGHPEHIGAWPADVYYADMVGTWTDTTVDYVNNLDTNPADAARITNVPGDGKFDQSTPPAVLKLQVGRVDLFNLPGDLQYDADPSFPSEQALLQQYLAKDHAFRSGQMAVPRTAVIGDYLGEKNQIAPAACGFRSFAPLVGTDPSVLTSLNITDNDEQGVWVPYLEATPCLLTYGGGAGSYTTISGLGLDPQYDTVQTSDLYPENLKAVFGLLCGSWFGDWDNQDNILRGFLAMPGYSLVAVFAGFPHWYLHPMGLGETIGYCARLTQNNVNLYQNEVNWANNEVHIALMGDPTLRLYPVAPPTAIQASASAGQLDLSWTASPDAAVTGYHIYRSVNGGSFTRLTSSPVAGTQFTDASAVAGATYLVRAIELETTPSGSFYNASMGATYAAGTTVGTPAPPSSPTAKLVNLSILAAAGSDVSTFSAGFVVGGASSGTMPILSRATGPALTAFGVTDILPNPVLTVYQNGSVIDQNSGWGVNAAEITAVDEQVSAFPLTNTASADAALVSSYATGDFSAVVTDNGSASGNALLELYDATTSSSAGGPRLTNLSARAGVTASSGMTLGFVVGGSGSEEVLIRGIGPGLAAFGVTNVLSAAQITLMTSSGTVLDTNAGWSSNPGLATVFSQVGAFALTPGSNDAALTDTLPPGNYSVQLTGVNGATGAAMVELYEVPAP